jgi:ABC-type sugar transport system ATPase subunit
MFHHKIYTMSAETVVEITKESSLNNQCELSFQNVCYEIQVKEKKKVHTKKILKGISGVVKPGEARKPTVAHITGQLLAIMGPSGGGKTTLLDALAFRTPVTSGEILLNGHKISTESAKAFISYVPQHDTLIGSLTVTETLHFYASLRLTNLTKVERNARVSRENTNSQTNIAR